MKFVKVLNNIETIEDLENFLYTLEALVMFINTDADTRIEYRGMDELTGTFRDFVERARTADFFRLPKADYNSRGDRTVAPPIYTV